MRATQMITWGFIVFLLCSSTSYAVSYDYSDAPYGNAWHTTDTWQKLGTNWDSEPSALKIDNDASDDGVWWSIDNGISWGHEGVYAGQNIILRVDMWSAGFGKHEYDQVKTWVDFNQDGIFQNDDTELVIAEQFFKPSNMIVDASLPGFIPGPSVINSYFVAVVIPENILGDLWLRARVSCWDTPFEDTTPYGHLWQGEVEDWKITVSPVPEPATVLLLGIGLIGIASAGRKKLKI